MSHDSVLFREQRAERLVTRGSVLFGEQRLAINVYRNRFRW